MSNGTPTYAVITLCLRDSLSKNTLSPRCRRILEERLAVWKARKKKHGNIFAHRKGLF